MTDLASTIARLRTLEAKATPGPWEESDIYGEPRIQCSSRGEEVAWVSGSEKSDEENCANKAMIVALRNAAPALLDAADRAEQIQWLRMLDEIARRREAEADRDRLAARVKELEAGLGPFAECAAPFGETWADTDEVACEPLSEEGGGNGFTLFTLRVGQFRRAFAMLAARPEAK